MTELEECKKIEGSNIEHHHEDDKLVEHQDHYDYLIGDKLHHPHGDHCDDHGILNLPKSGIIEMIKLEENWKSEWKFIFMIILTGGFFFVEIIMGIITISIALKADALHMLSDLLALIISYISIRISRKEATDVATYGWIRAEIIGGLINGIFLISSSIFIISEVIGRFIDWEGVKENRDMLIIIGAVGCFINIVGIIVFTLGNNSSNLNIKILILHILGDMLASLGVIANGLIIKYVKNDKKYLGDPIISIIIVLLLLYNAIPLVKQCCYILLQNVPKDINLGIIRKKILEVDGIKDLHHLHVWQLNNQRIIGTAHIITKEGKKNIKKVEEILHANGIHATTIQIEKAENNMKCPNLKCEKAECEKGYCCKGDKLFS